MALESGFFIETPAWGCVPDRRIARPRKLIVRVQNGAARDTDAERQAVSKGLLIAPQVDALFDIGFISVKDGGTLLVARALSGPDRILLGTETPCRVRGLAQQHLSYLDWHRQREFGR
jgi:hypothetical protein